MLYYLVLQNTTDLTIKVKKLNDEVYGGRFIKFRDVDFSDLTVGEYDYYLLANPEDWDIEFYANDFTLSSLIEPTILILANKRKIMANKDFILAINGKIEHPICPVNSGLLRYGNYEPEKKSYNKEGAIYKQYERK